MKHYTDALVVFPSKKRFFFYILVAISDNFRIVNTFSIKSELFWMFSLFYINNHVNLIPLSVLTDIETNMKTNIV